MHKITTVIAKTLIIFVMLTILYQIVLSLIMSALIEMVLHRRQKNTLNTILENIQTAKKEI
jgi:hypothetical protein